MALTSIVEYRGCRIHASRLVSETWVASVVARGAIVHHVRGEFESHRHAVDAAKQQIDQLSEHKTQRGDGDSSGNRKIATSSVAHDRGLR